MDHFHALHHDPDAHDRQSLARTVLFSFVITIIVSRVTVLFIMLRDLPDMYLYIDENHVHHLSYGIFLLATIGAYLLFAPSTPLHLRVSAIIYGIGLAFISDEFGMWIRLDNHYWQRASYDAISVVTATLAFIALLPSHRPPGHALRRQAALLASACVLFAAALILAFAAFQHHFAPTLKHIEQTGPQ